MAVASCRRRRSQSWSDPTQLEVSLPVCNKPVKSNQRGIQCEVCYSWLHAKCINLSADDYSRLQASAEPWCCRRCLKEALPFFDTSNSDSILENSCVTKANCDSNISAVGYTCSASQIKPAPKHSLNFLSLNCRSLCPKIDDLRLLSEAQSPHVISLCKTLKITPLFAETEADMVEVLPSTFETIFPILQGRRSRSGRSGERRTNVHAKKSK